MVRTGNKSTSCQGMSTGEGTSNPPPNRPHMPPQPITQRGSLTSKLSFAVNGSSSPMESTVSSSLRVWESGRVWSRTEPEAEWEIGPTLHPTQDSQELSVGLVCFSMSLSVEQFSRWRECRPGRRQPWSHRGWDHVPGHKRERGSDGTFAAPHRPRHDPRRPDQRHQVSRGCRPAVGGSRNNGPAGNHGQQTWQFLERNT